jgi:hypothetical protein
MKPRFRRVESGNQPTELGMPAEDRELTIAYL